ncbi:MAG TPA: NUDIX hydrolase [Candidatus Saccharimonadales bacterium]|jgi:ADP-ribose pyrophosphatase
MKAWKRIEPTIVSKIGWRKVISKTFIAPDGRTADFQTYDGEGQQYGGVIALTPDLQVVIARQFRPGPELIFEELPGGGIEEHDITDPQAGAMRELQEETGYVSDNVTYLGKSYKDAYQNATSHYYLALDCELHADGQSLDDGEHVDVDLISIDQLFENARSGRMSDVDGVFLAYEKLKGLQSAA